MTRATSLASVLSRSYQRTTRRRVTHAVTISGKPRCRPLMLYSAGVVACHTFPMVVTRAIAQEWRGLGVTCAKCLRTRKRPPQAAERARQRARRTVRT